MLENSHISVFVWMSDQFLSPLRGVTSNRQSTRSVNSICLKTLSQLNQSDNTANRMSTLAESLSLKVHDIAEKTATEHLLMAQKYFSPLSKCTTFEARKESLSHRQEILIFFYTSCTAPSFLLIYKIVYTCHVLNEHETRTCKVNTAEKKLSQFQIGSYICHRQW